MATAITRKHRVELQSRSRGFGVDRSAPQNRPPLHGGKGKGQDTLAERSGVQAQQSYYCAAHGWGGTVLEARDPVPRLRGAVPDTQAPFARISRALAGG